jgi:serine/threonine-protein kinase
VLKCLEKNPARRYPSAADLAADLDRYVRGDAVHSVRTTLATRLARWAKRESEVACRLVGQTLILCLTQVHFLINPAPDVPVHYATTLIEALWIGSSLVLRRVARSERRWELVRMIWIGLDVAMLTSILRVLGAADSSLAIGYPTLIAASGLWNRVRLVWLTTAFSLAGYTALVTDAWLRNVQHDSNHHPDIVLTGLVVSGFVVAQQVRRLRVLTEAQGTGGEAVDCHMSDEGGGGTIARSSDAEAAWPADGKTIS